MYPELYSAAQDDFTRAGIPLIGAYNVMVRYIINNPWRLSLIIPRESNKWGLIKRESIIKVDGQLFVVKIVYDGSENGKPYGKVEAAHIWWELCEKSKHIPSAYFFGHNAATILGNVFSGISYKSNTVRIMTDVELNSMGLEAMTARTDIDMDKTNPLAVLLKIIDNVGGEIYIDNFNFALVKQLGRDTGLKFNLSKNLKGIDRTVDTMQLVTRLFPYGKDNLEISGINGGRAYIDSPYINSFERPFEGFMDFRDIETREGLLERALFEFSPDNYNRIDKPKLTYKCDIVDLWKLSEYGDKERFRLGDYVTVHDTDLSIDSKVRVVEYDYYPYEAQNGNVTLGDPPKKILNILDNLSGIGEFYSSDKEIPIITTEIINSPTFHNTITEVTRQEVIAVENIHATSAFVGDMFVERLITNIVDFVCIPNLTLNQDGTCEWTDDEPTYKCDAPTEFRDIRPYIDAESIFMNFIESRLVPISDPAQLTLEQVEPLIVNGRQMYFTSILGGQAPYEFFTPATPESKYPDITPENAEMFKVYVRKSEIEHTKMAFNFKPVTIDEITTFEVEATFGVGDENGNGKMILKKSMDGAELLYTSRLTGEELGFKITDQGSFYKDVASGEWLPVGSGGHLILDRMPTQADIDGINKDTVVLVYDRDSPYNP